MDKETSYTSMDDLTPKRRTGDSNPKRLPTDDPYTGAVDAPEDQSPEPSAPAEPADDAPLNQGGA